MSLKAKDIDNIVSILLEADGGCYTCASQLILRLIELYPKYEDDIVKYIKEKDPELHTKLMPIIVGVYV